MKHKIKPDIIYGNVTSTEEELDLKHAKVRVTMFIDLPVVTGYKFLAKQRGAKYQTLMNKTLRESIAALVGGDSDDLYERVRKLEKKVFNASMKKPRK